MTMWSANNYDKQASRARAEWDEARTSEAQQSSWTEAAAKTTLTEIMAHLQAQVYTWKYIYTIYLAWCEKCKKSATLELWRSCNNQQQLGCYRGRRRPKRGEIESADCLRLRQCHTSTTNQVAVPDDYKRQSAVAAVAVAVAVAVEVSRVIDAGCGRAWASTRARASRV